MKSIGNKIAAVVLTVAAFALTACGTLSPLSHAQTVEQKAYALYGEFVVVEEQAAATVQNPEVGSVVRTQVAHADQLAKSAADHLLDTAVVVRHVKADLDAGVTTEDKLVIATINLQKWVDELGPQLEALIASLKGARP